MAYKAISGSRELLIKKDNEKPTKDNKKLIKENSINV
jgi:hypothetical protein